jgi:hypothetical protein
MQYFARRMNREIDIVPPETMQALVRYQWPGNIRELQNLIERAVILSRGPALSVPLRDLRSRATLPCEGTQHLTLEEVERAHILATLNDTKMGSFRTKRCSSTPCHKTHYSPVPYGQTWDFPPVESRSTRDYRPHLRIATRLKWTGLKDRPI